jgi:hypothetical protein
MSPTNQITDDAYDPADELRELLAEVRSDAKLHYEEERTTQLFGDYEVTRLSYTVTFDGFELEGTETISSIGIFTSLSGHLGCAGSVMLSNSLTYGEPTQIYIDEATASPSGPTEYRDLTVEWYFEPAVEAGIPEARLENRVVDFRSDLVSLSQLEDWVKIWLKAGN